MNSMENFFNWMAKPLPKDEVEIWFNVHNMNYEKIELYGDIFKSLNHIITDTYLGDDASETKIILSDDDNDAHFDWCWNKTLEDFRKENILIKHGGTHKDYFKSFFDEIFYTQKDEKIRKSITNFFTDLFDINKPFTKSDLDMVSTIYKILDKHLSKKS